MNYRFESEDAARSAKEKIEKLSPGIEIKVSFGKKIKKWILTVTTSRETKDEVKSICVNLGGSPQTLLVGWFD